MKRQKKETLITFSKNWKTGRPTTFQITVKYEQYKTLKNSQIPKLREIINKEVESFKKLINKNTTIPSKDLERTLPLSARQIGQIQWHNLEKLEPIISPVQ